MAIAMAKVLCLLQSCGLCLCAEVSQDRLEQCTSLESSSTATKGLSLAPVSQTVALSIYAGFCKLQQMQGGWGVLS